MAFTIDSNRETVKKYQSLQTQVLELHEAESYICLPSVVVNVTAAMGLVESVPMSYLRACTKHLNLNEFSILLALRESIKKSIE